MRSPGRGGDDKSAVTAMGLCARRDLEAEADFEALAQVKLLVPAAFRGYVPARHPALRYRLTLNDRDYFREAREILETVRADAPQGGHERMLLRACILIANGNLRLRMDKAGSAARMFGAASTELRALGQRKATASGDGFADNFALQALAEAEGADGETAFQGRLGGFCLYQHPRKLIGNKMHILEF
jgi:hypothetical protein